MYDINFKFGMVRYFPLTKSAQYSKARESKIIFRRPSSVQYSGKDDQLKICRYRNRAAKRKLSDR